MTIVAVALKLMGVEWIWVTTQYSLVQMFRYNSYFIWYRHTGKQIRYYRKYLLTLKWLKAVIKVNINCNRAENKSLNDEIRNPYWRNIHPSIQQKHEAQTFTRNTYLLWFFLEKERKNPLICINFELFWMPEKIFQQRNKREVVGGLLFSFVESQMEFVYGDALDL